jgi:nucleoside-diphosphate-sugar epimerase
MQSNEETAPDLATKTVKAVEDTSGAGRRLVVFGAGYVGGALARRAAADGWRVTALTRNPDTAAALRAAGCAVVVARLDADDWWDAPELRDGAERVAVTVAAGGGGAEGYRRSYVDGLASVVGWARRSVERGTGHLIYTSSTSVYPQGGGARVTEADPVGGEAETTRALVEAERIADGWPGPATILRLAGIYGPGRTHLVGQVRRGEASGHPEAHLNLIHRDDIVAACAAVWARGGAGGAGAEIFNLADEGAATKGEVVAWLAARLGVGAPVFTGAPAGGRRMVTPDRIIDAGRARTVLGWRAGRPTFREGYAEVLAAGEG